MTASVLPSSTANSEGPKIDPVVKYVEVNPRSSFDTKLRPKPKME